MNVLIVEDDRYRQTVVKNALKFNDPSLVRSLRERGISIPKFSEIRVAENRAEALDLIEERNEGNPFDLVILDLLIPEAGKKVDYEKSRLFGYDVLLAIRKRFPDTPVIVYSSYLNPKEDKEHLRGIQFFLDMLRERRVAPPDEMLWKDGYESADLLMRKLVRYAVDLEPADEEKLRAANILVPSKGKTRQVLRDLKRLACSASLGFPRSDVLLLGENGVGKTTFARAYHLLRPMRPGQPQLDFEHLDLGSLDFAGSAPNIGLFGATDFNKAWSLGAFVRSTMYKRKNDYLLFAGQRLHPSADSKSVTKFETLSDKNYPKSDDDIDFDGSGTLFLDEVVNIGMEVQAMLLQAISYDLHSRHVYTTGHAPRRLRVGPSLVFATAQQFSDMPGQGNSSQFKTMKDYLFRIDQTRITIPPLREREPSEVTDLLKELVSRRRPKGVDGEEIQIDPLVEQLLRETMVFHNNVADLQRIADQVMPEDHKISWQHVGSLFERERPLIVKNKLDKKEKTIDSTPSYTQIHELYDRYKTDYVDAGRVLPLSQLRNGLVISSREAYFVALLFMRMWGCLASKRWPKDEETKSVFGHGTKAFQTYLHRLSNHRNDSFGINKALKDLDALIVPNEKE